MMINWEEVAKMNNMSYEEFGQELIHTTMSFMQGETKRNNADEMIVSNGNLQLIFKNNSSVEGTDY